MQSLSLAGANYGKGLLSTGSPENSKTSSLHSLKLLVQRRDLQHFDFCIVSVFPTVVLWLPNGLLDRTVSLWRYQFYFQLGFLNYLILLGIVPNCIVLIHVVLHKL